MDQLDTDVLLNGTCHLNRHQMQDRGKEERVRVEKKERTK